MGRLIQISEAANLAIHALGYLAQRNSPENRSASEIAGLLEVSEAHLGKVLQRLAKFGLVTSSRGARGGFRLAREPNDVTLLEVVELMDGPIVDDQCLLGKAVCWQRQCVFQPMLGQVHKLIKGHLESTRLSQFTLDPSLLDEQ